MRKSALPHDLLTESVICNRHVHGPTVTHLGWLPAENGEVSAGIDVSAPLFPLME
jgi:hypothetical protein